MKTSLVSLAFALLMTGAASAEKLSLALNWKPEPQFGGFYQAELNSAYKNKNLEVQILPGGSGTPTVQMLAHKKVDAAIVSAEEILISNERNPKDQLVAVFATYQINPQMIMCHAEAGYKDLKDVYQSTATLAQQSGLSYAEFLKKKYPGAKVKIVPYSGGVSTFLADKKFCQQGFATSEPLAAEKSGAKPKVFLVSEAGFNPYTTVVAVRKETLEKNPDMVNRLVQAVRQGWTDYLKNPTAANEHMHKLNPAMDMDTFKKSADAQMKLITGKSGLGNMEHNRWQSLAGQLAELKVLKTKPDVESVYRNIQ